MSTVSFRVETEGAGESVSQFRDMEQAIAELNEAFEQMGEASAGSAREGQAAMSDLEQSIIAVNDAQRSYYEQASANTIATRQTTTAAEKQERSFLKTAAAVLHWIFMIELAMKSMKLFRLLMGKIAGEEVGWRGAFRTFFTLLKDGFGAARAGAQNGFKPLIHQIDELRKRAGLTNGKLRDLADALGVTNNQFVKMVGQMPKVIHAFKMWSLILAYIGTLAIWSILATFLIKLGKVGAAVEPVANAFGNLAEEIDLTSEALNYKLRKATNNTVADIDLMKNSVMGLNSGAIKTAEDLEFLSNAALRLGRTVGIDTTTALNNMIRGIGLMNPQLLKSLGILVSVDQAVRDYARAHHLSIEEMTDAERHEAFRLEVMRKTRESLRATAGEQATLLNFFQQTETSAKNFWTALTRGIAESRGLKAFLADLSMLLRGMQIAVEDNTGALDELITTFFYFGRALLWVTPGVNVLLGIFYGMAHAERDAAEASRELAASGLWEYFQKLERESQGLDDTTRRLLAMGDALRALPSQEWIRSRETIDLASEEGQRYWEQLMGRGGELPSAEELSRLADIQSLGDIGPVGIGLSAESLRQTKDELEGINAELAMLAKRREQVTDVNDIQRVMNQASEVLGRQIQLERAKVFWEESYQEALALANSELSKQNIILQDLVFTEDELTVQLTKQAARAREFKEEMEQVRRIEERRKELNDAIGAQITQAHAPGISPDQFVQDMMRLGIKPTAVSGGGVEAERMWEGLDAMASLRESQEEWNTLLSGSEEEMQKLLDQMDLAPLEMAAFTETLRRFRTEAARGGDDSRMLVASIGVLGGALATLVRGTEDAAQAIVMAAFQISQAMVSISNPVAGSIIGLVGGVVGALFSRDDKPQKVEIMSYSERALRQRIEELERQQQQITVQFVDSRGNLIEQQQYQLRRMEARDAVSRLGV